MLPDRRGLWIFWPSFCAALVPVAAIPATVANVVLALCGATLATFLASVTLRKGRLSAADVANATIAGGVAIGSTCDVVSPGVAFVIGLLAGTLSVVGYALIQARFQSLVKKVDTCGVIITLTGRRAVPYEDAEEFIVEDGDEGVREKGVVGVAAQAAEAAALP